MDIFKSRLMKTPIAHRGLHNDELPENSLGAFENAVKHGYAIELDVKAIDDGTVVIFHDDRLSRMTGKDGYISNINKTALKNYTLLKTDYTIPSLTEVFDLVDGKVPLLIEVKNSNKVGGLEKSLLELLKSYKGEFAVQSFNPYSMEFFKINSPNILRGQLSCFFKNDKTLSFFKKFMLKRMILNKRVSNPNFISYKADDLPNPYVEKYLELPVLAWTVTSESEWSKVKNYANNLIFEGFLPVPEQ